MCREGDSAGREAQTGVRVKWYTRQGRPTPRGRRQQELDTPTTEVVMMTTTTPLKQAGHPKKLTLKKGIVRDLTARRAPGAGGHGGRAPTANCTIIGNECSY